VYAIASFVQRQFQPVSKTFAYISTHTFTQPLVIDWANTGLFIRNYQLLDKTLSVIPKPLVFL
jgi:hypothetical protein